MSKATYTVKVTVIRRGKEEVINFDFHKNMEAFGFSLRAWDIEGVKAVKLCEHGTVVYDNEKQALETLKTFSV